MNQKLGLVNKTHKEFLMPCLFIIELLFHLNSHHLSFIICFENHKKNNFSSSLILIIYLSNAIDLLIDFVGVFAISSWIRLPFCATINRLFKYTFGHNHLAWPKLYFSMMTNHVYANSQSH